MQENQAFAVLNSIPYLGAIKIRHLIGCFGSALDSLQQTPEEIQKISGFERVLPYWSKWRTNTDWQNDLALVEKTGTQIIPFTSPLFPKSLLNISDHPALLYVQGELKPQDQLSIAIVGTRNASIYGNEMAHQIARDLAHNGFTVISGLARGVDTAAHQGALETGRTIAVIGSGLSNVYPPENRSLGQSISQNGALISEFAMSTPPDRQNFPQRNRVVSGMTLATLLIEAPVKSGAMITMDRAHTQKRKLFALPGRADSENFRGNHHLIKNGRAYLIENAADIMSHFNTLFPMTSQKVIEPKKIQVDERERKLLDFMTNEEVGVDELALLAKIPVHQANSILMSLVLKKAIKQFPGNIYRKSV